MAIYQGNGTWGPQSGVLGFLNPFSRDASITENALTVASGGKAQQASNWYNPKAIANANSQPQVYNIGGTQTKINPVPYDQINAKNALTGGTSGTSGVNLSSAATVDPGSSGGSSGSSDPHINPATGLWDDNYYASQMQASGDYQNEMRNSINSGWDSYMGQLNSMLNTDLPRYRTEQERIANDSANLAIGTAGTQKASSERAVQEQQNKSLKDLGSNVKNLFQSGNIYLGSRGAGDSSAANQYAYAITKLGSKGRADIMSQASSRMNQIKDIYDTQVNTIQGELNSRIGQIADWFYTQQQNLKSSLANAGLNREKDLQSLTTNLYNQSLAMLQAAQAEATSRRQALESWAMSNSQSTQQLISNLQSVQQMPAFSGIQSGMPTVDSQGNYQLPVGAGYFGSTKDEQKTGLFR